MARKQRAADCGLGAALTVIGGKWKPTILWELHSRPARFGELKRRVPGISEKVLFEQLREMEADGVVSRAVFDAVPPKVEYSLTKAGAALNDAVHALAGWGKKYASHVDEDAEGSEPLPPHKAQGDESLLPTQQRENRESFATEQRGPSSLITIHD